MAETEFKHPLDEQNAIERRIQLEGSRDPDHFTMPDGRTLTQVRQELDKQHREEAKNDSEAFEESSRNQSMAEFKRGGSLGITRAGNIVDTTNPEKSSKSPQLPHHSISEGNNNSDTIPHSSIGTETKKQD